VKIGVLGLGKLGLPLAYVYADAGHEVYGWDVNEDVNSALINETYTTDEPFMKDLMREHTVRIASPQWITDECGAVFIVVPTPSSKLGDFSDEHVVAAVNSLIEGRTTVTHLLIVLVSTVSPGTCDRISADLPEDIHLIYAPTLIALGTVIDNLRGSAIQLIGGSNSWMPLAAKLINTVAPRTPPAFMSYVSAELAKISFNAFNTMKITFANIVGQICDRYEGANVSDVLGSIAHDPRIGPQCFTAGAAYGGPCFPRDNRAFAQAAQGVDTLALKVHQLNEDHIRYICDLAWSEDIDLETFAILGDTYKEGVHHRIESFGDKLREMMGMQGQEADSLEDTDVLIIALPLHQENLRGKVNPEARVVDVWRTHGYLADEVREYVAFGRP